MYTSGTQFKDLFKKYRLRSEIETLAEFCNLMADEGQIYDVSIYTRWKNGERTPKDRKLILCMIQLFARRGGLYSVDEANDILQSVGLSNLTEQEVAEIQNTFRINNTKDTYENIQRKEVSEIKDQKVTYIVVDYLKKRGDIALIIYSFLLFSAYWYAQDSRSGRHFGDFSSIYFLVAFLGAIFGHALGYRWKSTNENMSKAVQYFSYGLFAQVFGQIVYPYYVFFQGISIPYPSIGDIGYFATIPLYLLGSIYMAHALGVKISWKSYIKQVMSWLIPLIILGVSYYYFLQRYYFDWSQPLKIFLDFGYPFGQSIYVSVALFVLLQSKKVFGNMQYKLRFLLVALVWQYTCDYTFLYQAYSGTWIMGGVNDYMYLISYTFMSLSLLQFDIPFLTNIKKD